MKNIKFVTAKYKGREFKSVSDAMFANWCDDCNQRYFYKPVEFELNGELYSPDFYLFRSKMIVEIKPILLPQDTSKLDVFFKDSDFDKFGLVSIEMVPEFRVIRFAEPCDNRYSDDRYWEDEGYLQCVGFCAECNAFNICGNGSWRCKACGYYDGDCTILPMSE